MGTKKEHLKLAASAKYPPEKILMIGDAPGDYQAAKSNQALFFPIVPGAMKRSRGALVSRRAWTAFSPANLLATTRTVSSQNSTPAFPKIRRGNSSRLESAELD